MAAGTMKIPKPWVPVAAIRKVPLTVATCLVIRSNRGWFEAGHASS